MSRVIITNLAHRAACIRQSPEVAQALACRVETRLDLCCPRSKSVGMSADAAGTSACATSLACNRNTQGRLTHTGGSPCGS